VQVREDLPFDTPVKYETLVPIAWYSTLVPAKVKDSRTMNASNKLLDKYAETCGTSKDTDIAARLHVSKQAVSGWRNAKAHPNADAVEKMCREIGEPLRTWLPLIEAERARTPADRKVWLRLAQAAAAIVTLYLISRLNVQTDVVSALVLFSRNPGTLYIMSNVIVGMIVAWNMVRKGVSPCSTGLLTA
jgi:transcriptional regulator with XRE-family HTH domain